jgi:hypothetical protein
MYGLTLIDWVVLLCTLKYVGWHKNHYIEVCATEIWMTTVKKIIN